MTLRTGTGSGNASRLLFAYVHGASPAHDQGRVTTATTCVLTDSCFCVVQIDYRSFLNKLWEAMPAEDFITMISDQSVLGNPLLRTQHFMSGASKWEKVSETEVIGHHQLRVPHQVYTDATLQHVEVKGHAHSYNTHYYRKVEGVWKFAGLNPNIRWSEDDFDKVFATGRDSYGDEVGEVNGADNAQSKTVKVSIDIAAV